MAKIRCGFVSNSSSSSFLIYGVELDKYSFSDETYLQLAKKQVGALDRAIERCQQRGSIGGLIDIYQKEKEKEKLQESVKNNDIDAIKDVADIEFFEKLVEGTDLQFESVMGEDNYIGKDPTKIPDDVTMGEWKETVKSEIRELFPNIKDKEFGWHEECWRDG